MYRNYLKSLEIEKATAETCAQVKRNVVENERDQVSSVEQDLSAVSVDFKSTPVPGYYHRPSQEVIQAVYHGNLQIPALHRGKVVRFFSSSTFTDTAVERNALMTQVYPKLQGFCKSQGYEMQVVDMRWGVRDGMTDDHMTSELCMRELRLCQEVSTGPNFVTFLGQKYGYRPFPPNIPASEFDQILSNAVDPGDRDLLVEWFLKDNNSVPPLYRLQPISSRFPNFVSKDKKLQRESSNAWWDVFERLQVILQRAASLAFSNVDVVHKYYRSVTEEEIHNGILKAPHANFHTCWFKRTINDALDHTGERALGRFIDMASGGVNKESQDLLKDLKEKKIPGVLSQSSIIPYSIQWCDDGGVNPDKEESHRTYLDTFLSDFEAVMAQRIEAAITARAEAEVKEPLFQEVIEHAVMCKGKVKSFHGRGEVLGKISEYVTSSSDRPLVVYGESGSGKTSVVAQAIVDAQELVNGGTPVIFRFLGTTSDSSTVSQLLYSLCRQICLIYGTDPSAVPLTYQKLGEAFPRFLSTASSDKPLVIFLDSLDQLAVDDGARTLVWLPVRLPPFVKMIVSTLPDEKYECFPHLKLMLPSDEHYVQVSKLPISDATTVIHSWFKNDLKTLQPSQLTYLLETFAKTPLPLFLRLIYDEAMRWRSYSDESEIVLKNTVREVIANMFERLELKHGLPLVSHAFGLITASKSGVSETEVEDILSCEDDVLNDVYQYWTPPLRRLPPMLFARIRADLGDYLVSRGADGTQVLNWYHRQFVEVSRDRYLSNGTHLRQVLHNLADYFLGTWAGGIKKEFTMKNGEQDSADRHLMSLQPLFFGKPSDKMADRKFNLRKLSELPHCLIELKDVERLKKHVVCNFEFLLAKIEAFSLNVVLDDVKAVESLSKDVEVRAIRETLQLAGKAIDRSTAELSSQLIGRLSQLVEKEPEQFKSLCSLLDGARAPSVPALIPQSQWLYPPGGQLIHTLPGHSKNVHGMALAKDNRHLVTASEDCTLRVWDLSDGKMFRKVDTEQELHAVELSNDDKVAITSSKSSLSAWQVNTGEKLYDIPIDDGPIKFCFGGDKKQFMLGLCEKSVRVWDVATGTEKSEFIDEELTCHKSCKIAALDDLYAYFRHETKPFTVFVHTISHNTLQHSITLQMYCQSMMTTSQGVLIVCVPMSMVLYNLDTGQEVMTIRLFDLYQPGRLQVTQDGKYLFGAVADLVKYWDLNTGEEEKFCQQSSGIMISNLVSNDLRTVAVCGGDNAIRLYDTSRENPVISPEYTGNGLNVIGQLYLTPDSQRHAVGTVSYIDEFSLCVYDTMTGEKLRKFKGISVNSVQFLSDTVAFLQTDNACYTCDLNQGELCNTFPATHGFLVKRPSLVYMFSECLTRIDKYDIHSAQLVSSIPLMLDSDKSADRNGLSFERSGAAAVYSVYHDYQSTTCYVVNLSDETCSQIPFNTKFSEQLYDSRDLLVFPDRETKSQLVAYSLTNKGVVQRFEESGGSLLSFTHSSKLNRLAYSLTTNHVKIYDAQSWQLHCTIPSYALHLKLIRDESVLLTTSSFASNSHVTLWDVESGVVVASLTPDESVTSVIVTDSGNRVTMAVAKTAKPTTFLFGFPGDGKGGHVDNDLPYGSAKPEAIVLLDSSG